ncbi:hypothetical protein R3Q06_29360 [Rhodococcus erythropolis]|uniref:hypothetical protein n=1 Tax=Rhodococcus erythropolis TaxID=1833 RepID=UPI002949432C|nr:hypothetical protein [Rhodococcus erythropolis]MDV6277604.1 hypothetical protein [Rhodococcus erythropolis]
MSFPGADSEIGAFPPAPMLVIPIDAAVAGIGTVAATLVTTPVYPMDVTGLGTASAAITASSNVPVGVTGEGEALAVFAQLIEAPVSGVSTAGVGVKPSITLAAGVTGSGTATATVTPAAKIVAAASCEGIPGVDAWPAATVTIAATGSGTPSAGLTARTPINASTSGAGTAAAAVTAVTFTASGMTKNGDMVGQTGSSAYRKLVGWTANTANYPGSTVVSDGLVSQSTKTGATITVALDAGSSWNNLTARLRISANGTVVVTGPDSTYTTSGGWNTPLTATATVNIVAGDVVTVEMSASPSGNYLTARTGAGTYVRIT